MAAKSNTRARSSRNVLQHRGYLARVLPNLDRGLLEGTVMLGSREARFRGATVAEAREQFVAAVDAYLKACQVKGETPVKPGPQMMLVRVPRERRERLEAKAAALGVTMTRFINDAIEDKLRR